MRLDRESNQLLFGFLVILPLALGLVVFRHF
jgi:hypothetical protein